MKEKTQIRAMLETLARMRMKLLAAERALTELAILDDKDHGLRVATSGTQAVSHEHMQVQMFEGKHKRVHIPGNRTKASFYTASAVRRARASLGMNQRQFAQHTGLSVTPVCEYESGKRIPTMRNQEKLRQPIEAARVKRAQAKTGTQVELSV